MSAMTSVVIFMPIIQHLGDLAGIDPIHLGVSVIMALACGPFTPPYGLSLLLAAQIGKVKAGPAFVAAIPMVGITVLIILVGMAFPNLFLFLPKLLIPTAFVR
jgi:TRAP-type C4-dicarboxylate transport system permease large subunit